MRFRKIEHGVPCRELSSNHIKHPQRGPRGRHSYRLPFHHRKPRTKTNILGVLPGSKRLKTYTASVEEVPTLSPSRSDAGPSHDPSWNFSQPSLRIVPIRFYSTRTRLCTSKNRHPTEQNQTKQANRLDRTVDAQGTPHVGQSIKQKTEVRRFYTTDQPQLRVGARRIGAPASRTSRTRKKSKSIRRKGRRERGLRNPHETNQQKHTALCRKKHVLATHPHPQSNSFANYHTNFKKSGVRITVLRHIRLASLEGRYEKGTERVTKKGTHETIQPKIYEEHQHLCGACNVHFDVKIYLSRQQDVGNATTRQTKHLKTRTRAHQTCPPH